MKSRPLRIFCFFSGGASAVRWLIENDPKYGVEYFFVGALTDQAEAPGILFVKEYGIPCPILDMKLFCEYEKYHGKLVDMPENLREKYFTEALGVVQQFHPDLIILSGFMIRITKKFLKKFPNRILNVHPADLSKLDPITDEPMYAGKNAVALALSKGEKTTRSTIHLVSSKVDCGRILVLSPELPVADGVSPKEHQELMKNACDGPAYQQVIRQIVSGEIVL